MQNRRRYLAASLVSSDSIRQKIEESVNSGSSIASRDLVPVLDSARLHRETNYHRLAFSTTTFPWKDPNPYSSSPDLLGVRIDVCERNGTFVKPYYVLLRRERRVESSSSSSSSSPRLSVFRHTVPAFIPIEKLAQRYLPLPRPRRHTDEFQKEDSNVKKQDLRAFVRYLRRELVAWHLRRDAIAWLQENLGLSETGTPIGDATKNASTLSSLAATSLESRYARLEWRNGRVGRFKISNSGLVERAVVIGDQGRDKKTEDILTGGDRRVESLVERLSKT